MVSAPSTASRVTRMTARNRQSVVMRAASSWRPWPRAWPSRAHSPAPSPMVREVTTKVTGKVKLMAASASVPSMPMKKVSTRLKARMATMPRIMGPVMRSSTGVMGAVSMGLGRLKAGSLCALGRNAGRVHPPS